jgi:hypothetical protein
MLIGLGDSRILYFVNKFGKKEYWGTSTILLLYEPKLLKCGLVRTDRIIKVTKDEVYLLALE